MSRLHRSRRDRPGITRQRRGRGFSYRHPSGRPVRDEATLERIRGLAIPPAWSDVWICTDPDGHLQAVGVDAAGRRQYLYHPRWRERRDVEKFGHVEGFAAALPALRARVDADIARRGLPRERVLALAVRLLDTATFRIGSDAYARANGSFGLATLRRDHVQLHRDRVTFRYRAKSGVVRTHEVRDRDAIRVVRALLRRPGRGGRLLSWVDDDGHATPIRADDINAYLREGLGIEGTAKDFRTWHATVLAALGFGARDRAPSAQRAQDREIRAVVAEVAEAMGNTPAVCRSSYIDPRVIDRYREGLTVVDLLPELDHDDDEAVWDAEERTAIERAVLALLAGEVALDRAA